MGKGYLSLIDASFEKQLSHQHRLNFSHVNKIYTIFLQRHTQRIALLLICNVVMSFASEISVAWLKKMMIGMDASVGRPDRDA
mgnify:CR=1 FL=1